ncbi:MAG: OmpA family protein, partial [Thermoanaerobaculia bacterium]
PPPPPPPQEIEESCLFDAASARVDNRCRAVLDEVALRLKQDPAATARIVGYTDATGSPARNEDLAMRRAEAARRVLVERHGIDPSRITVESRAANEPAASNDTAEGRQQNRRAVITVRLGS